MRLLMNRRPPRPSPELGAEAVLHPSPSVLTARGDDAVVLLDMKSEQYLGLDDAAATIWSGIEAGQPFRRIVHTLQAEYDADPAQLEADARAFVGSLLDRRLAVLA